MRLLHIVGFLVLLAAPGCYNPGALCSDVVDADPELTKITCSNDGACHYPGADEPQVACYYCKKVNGSASGKCAIVPGPFKCKLSGDPADEVCPDGYTCAQVPGEASDWCIRNDLLSQ